MTIQKENLSLLPTLLVVARANGSPVTYIVLSMRLAGLGGDRYCRASINELHRQGCIRIERGNHQGDQREKVVSLTADGWSLLRQLSETVRDVCQEPRTDGAEARWARA